MSLIGAEGGSFGGGLVDFGFSLVDIFRGGGSSRAPGPRALRDLRLGFHDEGGGGGGNGFNLPVPVPPEGGFPVPNGTQMLGGGACITPQLRASIGMPRIVDVPVPDKSGNLVCHRYVKAPMPRYRVVMSNPTRGRKSRR